MNRNVLRFALGTGLLVFGFMTLAGAGSSNGGVTRSVASLFDLSDRACRKASVGKGGACPEGCAARPPREPAERYGVPECRSRLWVATCGDTCAPVAGYVRLKDGRLAAADRLELELAGAEAEPKVREAALALGGALDASLSGLFRYVVTFDGDVTEKRLKRAKEGLAALPGVTKVEYVVE